MPYPAAPWQMHGQLWVSLFRVRAGDHPDRRPGIYGAALVSYEEPSPLTYSELLVARPVRAAGGRRVEIPGLSRAPRARVEIPGLSRAPRARVEIPGLSRAPRARVEITDIWVDSVDSRDGGRELWAIPKDLCDFERTTSGVRVCRTEWSASLDGRPIARARFTDVSGSMVRTPFRGSTWQQRREPDPRAGEEVIAPLRGSARSLPCRGTWEFDESGPLGWLAGKHPLASFRMADFAMSFG